MNICSFVISPNGERVGRIVNFRRKGDYLWLKPGNNYMQTSQGSFDTSESHICFVQVISTTGPLMMMHLAKSQFIL